MKIFEVLKEKISEYCRNSSLHGLKYIGQSSCSTLEKLFWAVSFMIAAAFGAYFIQNLFNKYNNNRVIVTINSRYISTSDLPFPTVTICNMNRVVKREAMNIFANGSELEKRYINSLCFSNESKEESQKETWKLRELIDFLIKISPSCEDMMKICRWNLEEVDCNNIFSIVVTDVGACCSFNRLPSEYVLRNPIKHEATTPKDAKMFQDWDFETKYDDNRTIQPYPRTLRGAGLSIVLDTDIDNYYCSITNSVGYMLQFDNPSETPKLEMFGIHTPPGLESSIKVMPVIADSEEGLRGVPLVKRKCYFNGEKYLRHYKVYTRSNCIKDCQVNYTIERCGCLPYFIMKLVQINEKPPIEKSLCKCLPSCSTLKYDLHFSFGKLVDTFNVSADYLRNVSLSYFVKNMAVVNVYFPETASLRLTKNEIYGEVELMSNIGGLLAIFLGFSFLSATEIVYYIVCEILPSVIKALYNDVKETQALYPFTK